MEYKSFPSKVLSVENDRTIAGISAVMGVLDAGYDRLFKGAFTKTLEERADRVKHLWQHDYTQPPTAAIVEMKEVGRTELPPELKAKYPEAKGGLYVKRSYLDTPRGNEVLAGLKSEPAAVTEMSFGYDPVKFDFEELTDEDVKGMLVRNLREVRLWDTSDVNWGMNAATVALIKMAMPYKDCGIADEGMDWSKPNLSDFTDMSFDEMTDAQKKRIAAHYTWSANNPPESFGDLKLPHHQPSKDGVGPAVWKGVSAAMGRLMQSNTDIPEGDRKAVYNHLVKHYEQFTKEPPEFKVLSLLWSVGDMLTLLAPDARPNVKNILFNMDRVFNQLTELDELLRAEPKPVDLAALLTQQKLAGQLAIRQRQLALIAH